jgi:superfamily I DNA/RNA helicase
VDIRGRSRTLTVNYRTSHQIRQHADLLLEPSVSDVDGEVEVRKGTISVFDGPPPEIRNWPSVVAESAGVADWIRQRMTDGLAPHEIGVIVRSDAELPRARAAVEATDLPFTVLDDQMQLISTKLCICTMHLAKGLEFRAVAVMACDDQVIPSQSRIEEITDEADLEEVYATERHLLYVAVTRARDRLLVSSAGHASEFLDDLGG